MWQSNLNVVNKFYPFGYRVWAADTRIDKAIFTKIHLICTKRRSESPLMPSSFARHWRSEYKCEQPGLHIKRVKSRLSPRPVERIIPPLPGQNPVPRAKARVRVSPTRRHVYLLYVFFRQICPSSPWALRVFPADGSTAGGLYGYTMLLLKRIPGRIFILNRPKNEKIQGFIAFKMPERPEKAINDFACPCVGRSHPITKRLEFIYNN